MSILKRSITITAMAFLGTVAGLAAAPSEDLAGSYEVKFEQISSNCEHPIAYPQRGSLKIEVRGSELQVDIERTPLMVGKRIKNGTITAKSPRPGHTPIQGVDGVFSVAGRITSEGTLALVMTGEYQASGKPLCTQSWNLSGLRTQPNKPKHSLASPGSF